MHWHRLPREVLDATSLEVLEARLDGTLSWSSGTIFKIPPYPSNFVTVWWSWKHLSLPAGGESRVNYLSIQKLKARWCLIHERSWMLQVSSSPCCGWTGVSWRDCGYRVPKPMGIVMEIPNIRWLCTPYKDTLRRRKHELQGKTRKAGIVEAREGLREDIYMWIHEIRNRGGVHYIHDKQGMK